NTDFQAVLPAYIIAHGDTQLWGFVVLFILGISLRTVLRAAMLRRGAHWLSRGFLILGLIGVGGNFAWCLFPERLAT
ncbi:MAG: hypothetical protein KJZ78_27060, partial [Bryobacteraceae bacterium]|nr:hypothetical protein [Bryobacteraceae bacterium]